MTKNKPVSKTTTGKTLPTTHKKGRYEKITFTFYDHDNTLEQIGTVLIRDDAMVLEIPEQDGYPPALVIGKPSGRFFRGTNSVRDRNFVPVDARWADVGNMFVGSWQDDDYDLVFYFELPD